METVGRESRHKGKGKQMENVTLELTVEEARTVEKALRLLRDRHYNNYYRANNQHSESALKQLAIYEELEELRNRYRFAAADVTRAKWQRIEKQLQEVGE